jgi:hypothetical protein
MNFRLLWPYVRSPPNKYNLNLLTCPINDINQTLPPLQALRVPLVSSLASASASANSCASPSLTTTLSVLRNGTATRSTRGSSGDTGASRWVGAGGAELAVDEGQCLLPVHVSVALVRVRVVAVAAVRISRVAVALDLACGWALETRWAGGELGVLLAVVRCERWWEGLLRLLGRFRRCRTGRGCGVGHP